MKYEQIENKIIMSDFESFHISDILECGQCFRFSGPFLSGNNIEYTVFNADKFINIRQTPEAVEFFPCEIDDFENIWIDYFDLRRNYSEIKEKLSADPVMERAIEFAGGIRILNADIWECLISFIISQNNRIPMIKRVVMNLTETFGEPICPTMSNAETRAFPRPSALAAASLAELAACKTGFRNKYISDAALKVSSGEINISDFANYSTEELRDVLIKIKGVGMKVADCVMLFSCGRSEVFPTDVWIGRIMRELYFDGREVGIAEIHEFAREKFGIYAGFAQQYLFHYARIKMIGAKKTIFIEKQRNQTY